MNKLAMAGVLLGTLALAGCTSSPKVGVVLPETGQATAYGSSIKAGLKLAFDDAIAAGKAPRGLEVVYRDSTSNAEKAAEEAGGLFGSGALLVIGGATTAEAKAIIPVAEKRGGIVLSPSASEAGLAVSSNRFFRVYPSDQFEAELLARFLVRERKARNILIIEEDTPYARGLVPIFLDEADKFGAALAGRLTIGTGGWEARAAELFANKMVDAVFICGYDKGILAALEAIRRANFPGTVCSTSAVGAGEIARRGGPLVEGLYFPMVEFDPAATSDPTATFVRRFTTVTGHAPDLYAAHGYDAGLVALAVLSGQPVKDANDLVQRLFTLEGLTGVTGQLGFDAAGDTKHRPRLYKVEKGAFVGLAAAPTS